MNSSTIDFWKPCIFKLGYFFYQSYTSEKCKEEFMPFTLWLVFNQNEEIRINL